jgi:replication initiation and membrane attachment protein DnaB
MRLFAILVALGLLSINAEAQVFKPKKGKTDSSEKKAKSAKKSTQTTKKKAGSTKKKSAAAERSRPDDLTPEPASKDDDEDFVKITDDDEIE